MLTRRHLLQNLGMGAGLCGLAGTVAGQAAAPSPLSARNSHHPIRAKRLIFLFMAGGPSHVDLFDPKPRLEEFDGKPAPFKLPNLERTPPGKIRKSPFTFRRYGESGIDVSEMFPHVARHVDDLCVIRSMVADNINHNGACLQMNTGEQTFSRPSMGSWLLYGLGTGEPEPARVCRGRSQPAGPGSPPLGFQLSAGRLPGHLRHGSQATHHEPGELRWTRTRNGGNWICWPGSTDSTATSP
ncbi:MAG: hypothetical protein CM1200mP2_58510 [Planctomycetaceae bacterium]|nr:MAG: hypothetical protein CM1200mP2_58510 [Planctomycetaceae bacterium]